MSVHEDEILCRKFFHITEYITGHLCKQLYLQRANNSDVFCQEDLDELSKKQQIGQWT